MSWYDSSTIGGTVTSWYDNSTIGGTVTCPDMTAVLCKVQLHVLV